MHLQYFKCRQCNSILETCISEDNDRECLNCMNKDIEEITKDAPGWVIWCDQCKKKDWCEKIKNPNFIED